jgi:hypothetical protein
MNTHVKQARERVVHEREEVVTKREAYNRFRARLESISPQTTTGVGNTLVSSGSGSAAGPIREAFVETIEPVCEDRPTVELLTAELGDGVTTALTTGGVSPALHRAIRTETGQRQAELAAMDHALGAETDSLDRATETIDPIRAWLIEENETPLSACGFEDLRMRHACLAGFRKECDALVADRQEHLGRTTGADGQAGVRHHNLLEYLYEEFPINYPVLVTAARLNELCTECQRSVRDHLVRRV